MERDEGEGGDETAEAGRGEIVKVWEIIERMMWGLSLGQREVIENVGWHHSHFTEITLAVVRRLDGWQDNTGCLGGYYRGPHRSECGLSLCGSGDRSEQI